MHGTEGPFCRPTSRNLRPLRRRCSCWGAGRAQTRQLPCPYPETRDVIQERISSTRHAVTRADSLTGAGKAPDRTSRQRVAAETGRTWARRTDWRTKPDAGRAWWPGKTRFSMEETPMSCCEESRSRPRRCSRFSSWKKSFVLLKSWQIPPGSRARLLDCVGCPRGERCRPFTVPNTTIGGPGAII